MESMIPGLAGRRVAITGAASGIGAAVARRLAALGAATACLDLDPAGASAVAAGLPGRHLALAADVADAASVRAAVDTAAADLGGLDGLVTCAGVVALGPSQEIAPEIWARMLAVNLTGTFLTCQAALPHLLAAPRDAAIVTVASAQALMPVAGAAAYAASKGGVLSLSKALAVEFAPGIRVNAVCPGLVDTPMNAGLKTSADDGPPVPLDRYPLARWGRPEEIAASICFLLSADAGYMTGATIAVDGGRTFH